MKSILRKTPSGHTRTHTNRQKVPFFVFVFEQNKFRVTSYLAATAQGPARARH
jgi:hypothetical protein